MRRTSFSYPNLFDVSRNKVNLYDDVRSIVNRVKLLMLTEPTELFMNPNFGVGLKKYMFMYNNDNVVALIQDKLIEQLRMWEPLVVAEKTVVSRGLEYTGADPSGPEGVEIDHLKLTVTLTTTYSQTISFEISEADYQQLA